MTVELVLLTGVAFRGESIAGPRLRGLLALLAADLRTGCGTTRLVDGLWPEERPDHPIKAVQILVSRARAQLGTDLIARTPTGYRLALAEDEVDATSVLLGLAAAIRQSRAGDEAGALAHAEVALAHWDGVPVADDSAEDPVAQLRAERATTHRSLLRVRALALSRLDRAAEATRPLAELHAADPRDEEVLVELLRCEAATAGQEPGVRHGPSPLLGRAADINAVTTLIAGSRVTSIVGPGGLGKTRVAYEVSRAARQRFVQVVPLAGVGVDAGVTAEVVTGLGDGPALLVLDGCEHVLAAVADLVGTLIASHGDLRVLTTSRAPLGLPSESVYALPALDLDTMVELFNQRAHTALPQQAVRELCARLDGLPLAVELAAARVRELPVAEIAARLGDRTVLDWSWTLLDPAEQAAMRALSVFPNGFTASAVDDPSVLTRLVDHALLTVAGPRFWMPDTIREFVKSTADDVAVFLAWARDFGIAWHDALFGADPVPAVESIRAEQDNLMFALRLGLDRADGATVAATAAVLAALWTVESRHSRLAALTERTAALLVRFRPPPELVEPTRTALALCAAWVFTANGPRASRALLGLHRLPKAEPDTPMRALATVLTADRASLPALCDSREPLLAAAANGLVGDLDDTAYPWPAAIAHTRIAARCLATERGERARHHLLAALDVFTELGAWAEVARLRLDLVLANLQLGAIDDAERALTLTDEPDLGARAEIALARGEVDTGLRLWRRAVDRLDTMASQVFRVVPGTLETRAVAVIAHAQHGRLDLVADTTAELPAALSAMLRTPNPADRPLCGALLLALAMVGLDRAERAADERGVRSAARMIALAERFGCPRGFQPTMCSARARAVAEHADRAAYAEAVSSYANLSDDELHAAARVVIAG